MTTYRWTGAEAFPPGEYLRDELEAREWTATEFAEIIGRPLQAVSEILNGKKEITTETAIALGDALGTSAEMWLNLQTAYRLFTQRKLTTSTEPTAVQRRARMRRWLPVSAMQRRGWLTKTDDLNQLESEVKTLLEIDDMDDAPTFAVAARRANEDEPISAEQTAWLAHIRKVARTRPTPPPLNRDALTGAAGRLPRILRNGPSDFNFARQLLFDAGVAVVVSEGLPSGKLDGAVSFLPDETPVIGLTTRGDRFDGLLFTLLHECAHITLGHLADNTGSIVDPEVFGASNDIESAANLQAKSWLFPEGFKIAGTSPVDIIAAANEYEVHPSVVLGQIQWTTDQWKLHRSLITKVRAELASQGALE